MHNRHAQIGSGKTLGEIWEVANKPSKETCPKLGVGTPEAINQKGHEEAKGTGA